ncbi:hypothetical protein B0A50_06609 [Salinomyces thailandicus]|uniref:Uncharacterized protein n=1 Tax=Salinomyces thailandicus TaxID=706561 RepID=A0A4U0TRV9_9PEZI|nr:hypothetical protein B0A50_06609 [Salinomyces thailandica]
MPQHKRGPWSQTEDQYLLHLVNLHGAHNWVRISSTIQTRSPKQCRERYHQNLKPNLNHDPITPEEGLLIEQMVGEMGKRWAEIARRLRGRSDNAVKNWWNGGMNRRRRSNNPRRADLDVRQQQHVGIPSLPPPPHQHPHHHHHQQAYHQQPHFAQHVAMQPQYFGAPMYHPAQMHQPSHMPQPHHISVPSNAPLYHRHSALIETPLPSPSAFSQLSADGAPSLVSDCSSISGRSPHHGPSPIELPPLSGSRNDRRHSAGPLLRLGVPGTFAETDYQQSMAMKQHPHLLQEAFVHQPQPQYLQPASYPQQQQAPAYLPSQPRHPSPMQMQPPQLQGQYDVPPQAMVRPQSYQQMHMPTTPAPSVQLPSISKLKVSGNEAHPNNGFQLDPALTGIHGAMDDSPKDKMSLSNLTH